MGLALVIRRLHSPDRIQLITQHDHAVLSGVIAAAWGPERPSFLAIAAAGLHDSAWIVPDRKLLDGSFRVDAFDQTRGLPHDFLTLPALQKSTLYRQGVDNLESVDPATALLVSRHYCAFMPRPTCDDFRDVEERRQEKLCDALGWALERTDDDLKWVQWFDLISLAACVAAGRTDAAVPSWLSSPFDLRGVPYEFEWQAGNHYHCTSHHVFDGRLSWSMAATEVVLPATGQWDDADAFRRALRDSTQTSLSVHLSSI